MRILLVEDEVDLARVIRHTLEEEGHACDWAAEGESALHEALTGAHDVIVLDLMLPIIDGLTVLGALRDAGRATPVLILTARDAVEDRVRGLDAGADDYLTKPFSLDELLARIRALIRRSEAKVHPRLEIGDVHIDTAAHSVERAGRPVPLTGKEYALLELLAFRQGILVDRSTLFEHLYADDDEVTSNLLDVYIANLRRKLGKDLIRTRRGEGYIIP